VVSGQHPPALLERLQATLETIHLHFNTALADFEGDAAPFEAAKPLLEECLEKVLTTDRPSTRGATPRVAWVIVGVVVIVVLALWIRSSVRWNRAMAALESEPGIVLVEVDRGIRGGRLTGLRDPMARHPAELLLASRIDTSRIDGRWEPYLSFDAPIVTARARRALNAPGSLFLELVGDTLSASGSATFDWLSNAEPLISHIPGVSHLDFSSVEAVLPPDLANLQREIEARRILFDIGSYALVSSAPEQIAEIAALYLDLLESGRERGYTAALELIGRTDTTGSNETNRVLSQSRATRVLQALAARGVLRTMLTERGIGTSDPISSTDPEEEAALNRSVSLRVTVTYGSGGEGNEE
jgi:OOP family OmpA-OmpF porin